MYPLQYWSLGRQRYRPLNIVFLCSISVLSLLFWWKWSATTLPTPYFEDETVLSDGVIILPSPYPSLKYGEEEPGLCSERYGTHYIRRFSDSATNQCTNETAATLTCFTHKAHDTRTDSFCVGLPTSINPAARTVDIICPIRPWTDDDRSRHAAQISTFPTYWYNTGPSMIFDHYINIIDEPEGPSHEDVQRTVLLIQREETIDNLWHTLMQVMSVWLSLDILRTTANPVTKKPFYSDRDVASTQALILDQWGDGPFFELWNMFGGIPTTRMNDLDGSTLSSSKILVPLPGGSNPFWQGDWADLACDRSALLMAFSRRMLNFYNISQSTPRRPKESSLKLLFIDRRGQRKLDNQDALFAALQSKYSDVEAELVDFAAMTMSEQLHKVQSADILAGVHGAGLTHGMFLPPSPSSTVVEIQPPALNHKGFKSMAGFLGHQYFTAPGVEQDYEGKSGDWHKDTVFIGEQSFLELMGAAISSARNLRASRL